MKVTVFSCDAAVNESETLAIEHLKQQLQSVGGNDEWILLTNLAFSVTHQFQSDEIDIIAIGFDGPRILSPAQVISLSRALAPKSAVAVDGSLRRLAGYVNLELQTPKVQTLGLTAADQRSEIYSLCACLSGLFASPDDGESSGATEILAAGQADAPEHRQDRTQLDFGPTFSSCAFSTMPIEYNRYMADLCLKENDHVTRLFC